MFYMKSVLVIDGKNNNDDGKQEKHKLRRRSENMQRSKQLKRRIVTVGYESQINDMDELRREKVESNNLLVLIPQSV
jgi:hypothetical protein